MERSALAMGRTGTLGVGMAELIFNNLSDTFARGYGQGAGMREDKKQQQDQSQLRALAPAIIGGDLAAYGQAAAIDPAAAQQYQQSGDVTFKRLAGAYKLVDDARKVGDMRAVNAALRQTAPFFSQVLGKPVPTEWAEGDQAWEDGWGKLGQQIAMATQGGGQGKVFAQKISDDGYLINTYADGTVQKTDQKVDRQAWFRDQEGLPPTIVNKDGTVITPGGAPAPAPPMGAPRAGTQADADPVAARLNAYRDQLMAAGLQPGPQLDAALNAAEQTLWQSDAPQDAPAQVSGLQARPSVSPVEAQRLSLAEQANQRAAEASQRAEQAAVNAQRGNAPTGFRFKADGSLEPIPGGPKPAGAAATEGERKAATLLTRLTGSLSQLEQAVKEDPDAASPNLLATGAGALLGETVGNKLTPATRQRVEAAQLDILDAALTLGTGAAYTREQLEGYRRSYFPQIGDSPGTVKDKSARLNNVIQAAKIAAGRAAPAPSPDDDLVNKYLD
jgi:hypothetical protein